jgi:hypothetical protein
MRRFIVLGILLAGACTGGSASGPSLVSSITVSSNASANGVFVGDQVQLNATALDANGNIVPVTITYSSSNLSVATVNATGLITAVGAGTSQINVMASGSTSTLTLTVDGNVSSSLQITPVNPTVALGQSLVLTANVLTTLGNPARNKTVSWSTADATKVTIDQTGKATGVAATIGVSVCAVATDNANAKGCTTVTVQPPDALSQH